jgi:predicted metal-dependent phosphoesterase TrpH
MGGIDLHVHTNASDGAYAPSEIIRIAAEAGLSVLAITDHDNVGGIGEAVQAAAAYPQLRLIPGVELSTDVADGEVHVLGYCLDYEDAPLLDALKRMRNSRLIRARKMVARLGELGRPVEWQRVLDIAGEGSVGRPHIAKAMMERGYINSVSGAFDGYLEHGGPAYFERDKMTPPEAVELILAAGGLPVMAHPMTVPDPETVITDLVKVGLAGIEVYYASHSPATVARLAALAAEAGLIPTGGTDYHGLDAASDTPLGSVSVPAESVARLLAMAKH